MEADKTNKFSCGWNYTLSGHYRKRQVDLEAAGFTIMRFEDENVLSNINFVISEIEDWITKNQ